VFEFTTEGLLFAYLYWRHGRAHEPGRIIGLYLVISSIACFAIEFTRHHEQALPFGLPLSITQWIAIGLALLGVGAAAERGPFSQGRHGLTVLNRPPSLAAQRSVVLSVMVAARNNPNLVRQYLINQPVLLIDSPRPATSEFVLQRLWLAQAGKWFTLDLTNKADIRIAWERSCSIHQAKSSKAEASNSRRFKFQASRSRLRGGVHSGAASHREHDSSWLETSGDVQFPARTRFHAIVR
jgi:Prolipoprotein diacylglyceryl transferase